MDTKPIWTYLSSIPVGTVIAWIAVITSIVGALCATTVKLYKVFLKYKRLEDKECEQTKQIKKHDEILTELSASLCDIKKALEEQRRLNLKQLRHTIVDTCESALERDEISINKYRSLEEMYDEYDNTYHANSYAKSLVLRVREELFPKISNTSN